MAILTPLLHTPKHERAEKIENTMGEQLDLMANLNRKSEPRDNNKTEERIASKVSEILGISDDNSLHLAREAERLYVGRMRKRFSELRVSERLKRTNPFLLRIRGANTVRDWADLQVRSALYASEEEAVGHLLEAIAKICFPGAQTPKYPDDFDFEAIESSTEVHGYQVKMSWDCMPMSSRKNLSNTIRKSREIYEAEGKEFTGYFAPCYGKAKTSTPPGQEYVSLASKEFWERVGGGFKDFDVRVGEVCSILCSEFRAEIEKELIPSLLDNLTAAAQKEIGDSQGYLDYTRLFRRINR
ncbi:PmeII family type II restriction endonuclease [Streptomonospora algeriensis]|uniref:PmeII family type II restriction endonuclease n=1 Tax=Streptomonospora algeriensis TaxID=995084 RepID=A0ABW3BAC1_9ACTN